MTEAAAIKGIYDELKLIREEVDFIKKHMFDPDTILTAEEYGRFEKSLEEFNAGKTTPLSKLKKELRL